MCGCATKTHYHVPKSAVYIYKYIYCIRGTSGAVIIMMMMVMIKVALYTDSKFPPISRGDGGGDDEDGDDEDD